MLKTQLNLLKMKRFFDIAGALVRLVFAAPILAITIILVKRDSGSAFFTQKRVG